MEVNSSIAVAAYSGQGSPAITKPTPSSSQPQHQDYNTDSGETAAASTNVAQTQQPQAIGNSKNSTADEDSSRGEKKQSATEEQIQKAIDKINEKAVNSEAVFGIHEKTKRVTIKIVDKKTKDVIKELPPEKTLDLIAKAWEMAGLLVDEKR